MLYKKAINAEAMKDANSSFWCDIMCCMLSVSTGKVSVNIICIPTIYNRCGYKRRPTKGPNIF